MKVKQIKIYRQICEVYGQNVMSDSMVRRWDRHFNEGRSEVHDEERSGRPSLITEELVHAIDEKIKENHISAYSPSTVKHFCQRFSFFHRLSSQIA
ncbi:UNVERIFIED_CONTAM: hypothetical protein NCL1_11256 [Trichonephila clavipes]